MSEEPSNEGALREYERKRGRAMRHFETLREVVEGFTDRDREAVRGNFNAESKQYVFEVPLERHPPDWALTLGDYAYNERASLDYLITALVRSAGADEHTTSEFPIYGIDRVGWAEIDQWWEADPKGRIGRQLRDTPSGTKAALKKLPDLIGDLIETLTAINEYIDQRVLPVVRTLL